MRYDELVAAAKARLDSENAVKKAGLRIATAMLEAVLSQLTEEAFNLPHDASDLPTRAELLVRLESAPDFTLDDLVILEKLNQAPRAFRKVLAEQVRAIQPKGSPPRKIPIELHKEICDEIHERSRTTKHSEVIKAIAQKYGVSISRIR